MHTLQKLLKITAATPDREVAILIAEYAISMTDVPYRFAINHDVRPPKLAACSVEYTWTRKDRCGVDWTHRTLVKKWLTQALLCGYTVYLMTADHKEGGFASSIAAARKRAQYHQQAEARRAVGEDDDDIPF